MIYVYYLQIGYYDIELVESLIAKLPDSLHKRAKRYINIQSKISFAVGRLILKYVLQSNTDFSLLNFNLENITYNENDKPHLNSCYFNISHSKNTVVLAISKDIEMGIDIEFYNHIKPRLFKHFFNNDEFSDILKDDTFDTFFNYWTKKESAIKKWGIKMKDVKEISVSDKDEITFKETIITSQKINLNIDSLYCTLSYDLNLKPEIITIKLELDKLLKEV